LINTAKKAHGFQLGLINVADSFEKGVPLGLFSFVKNGFQALEISATETIYGNLTFKMGVDQLYTLYKIGFASNNGKDYMTYGIGLGGMHSFSDRLKLSLDLSANHIIESKYTPRLDILSKADFALRYHLNKNLAFYAGPSVNVYVSQFEPAENNPALHVPYVFFEDNWWNNQGATSLWIGGQLGISWIF